MARHLYYTLFIIYYVQFHMYDVQIDAIWLCY